MKRSFLIVSIAIGMMALPSCDPAGPEEISGAGAAVIDGADHPDDLGFEINRLEVGAVGGQRREVGDYIYQGCSGTLAGDRLVVTASHCVVSNQEEWMSGAEAIPVNLALWELGTGDDIADPECLFHAEAIHIHPEIAASGANLAHDIAIVQLSESVIETCPTAVPLPMNTEEVTDEMVGELFLQGGFGSLDGTYDFSPIRQWSLIEFAGYSDTVLAMGDAEEGFPTFGDSGSGTLRRFADGTLRNMGVASRSGASDSMIFTRMDANADFIESVATPELLCGPVGEAGKCIDEFFVSCDENGFTSLDCTEVACPLDCPCECDVTLECDGADCACDPECVNDDGQTDAGTDDDSGGNGGGDCSAPGNMGSSSSPSLIELLVAL